MSGSMQTDPSIIVSEVRFFPSRPDSDGRGLLGFLSFVLNGAFRIDGVTLRESADGRMILSFPSKTDRQGIAHNYFMPISDSARLSLQSQIFKALPRMIAVPKGQR